MKYATVRVPAVQLKSNDRSVLGLPYFVVSAFALNYMLYIERLWRALYHESLRTLILAT